MHNFNLHYFGNQTVPSNRSVWLNAINKLQIETLSLNCFEKRKRKRANKSSHRAHFRFLFSKHRITFCNMFERAIFVSAKIVCTFFSIHYILIYSRCNCARARAHSPHYKIASRFQTIHSFVRWLDCKASFNFLSLFTAFICTIQFQLSTFLLVRSFIRVDFYHFCIFNFLLSRLLFAVKEHKYLHIKIQKKKNERTSRKMNGFCLEMAE